MQNAIEDTAHPRGVWWRLQGIFFQPRMTFEMIDWRPTWLVVLLLTIVISTATAYLTISTIGFENIMTRQLENSPRAAEMSPEQLETLTNSSLVKAAAYLGAVVGVPAGVLVTAVFLMLAFWMAGSDAPFGKVFSAVAHSFFAYTVITSGLALIVVGLVSDPSTLDVANLVASNPGALVDRKEWPVLASLLSSLDVLTFYYLGLLSLGLSIVGRKSWRTSGFLTFAVWLIWLAAKAGWTAVFS